MLKVGRTGMSSASLFEMDESRDNVTDWALKQFHDHYGRNNITKDDIWEYLYGIMHAPDWRERYANDLKRQLPRVPFAPDFEAYREAGRQLMDLHISYETCPELAKVECFVDGSPDQGAAGPDAYRIDQRMKWASKDDRTVLHINQRCRLVEIPDEAHRYQVSGRSPLQWAVDSLRLKEDNQSGIVDDPNKWHVWEDDADAFELIRHLRRLAFVGVRSTEIIEALPPSLTA